MYRAPLFSFTGVGQAGKLGLNKTVDGVGNFVRLISRWSLRGPNSNAPGFAGDTY